MQFDDRFVRQAERIRDEISSSGLPMVVLADGTKPADEWFDNLTESAGAIVTVAMVYAGGDPGDPWVWVEAGRAPQRPRRMLEAHMRRRGDPLDGVQWTEGDATVLVDGRPVEGHAVWAGHRWWAVRCAHGDLEIGIVALDWRPDVIAVDTTADVAPILDRLRFRPAYPLAPSPDPLPGGPGGLGGPGGEPHRALIEAVLRQRQVGAAGEPPAYWAALWQAAVRRQAALAEQSEPDARRTVAGTVEHLSALSADAGWFRADGALRERAIAETLLYDTGLSHDVPSRPAQQAWSRKREHAARGAQATAHLHWIDAWTAWAKGAAS